MWCTLLSSEIRMINTAGKHFFFTLFVSRHYQSRNSGLNLRKDIKGIWASCCQISCYDGFIPSGVSNVKYSLDSTYMALKD